MSCEAPLVAGLLIPPRIFRELGPVLLSWATIWAPGSKVRKMMMARVFRIGAFPACVAVIIATRIAAVFVMTGQANEGFYVN